MKKIKQIPLPDEVWVMGWYGTTMVGSFNHIPSGEKFFRTKEECQVMIDNMEPSIGMGNRQRYRPTKLISCEKKEEY